MDDSPRLSGEEWQLWADRLLKRHYGPGEYQTVPDNQKGDAGIEGFTISSGHAYQAYGPEEPLTTDQRLKKHQKKMSDDIRKFIQNRDTLAAILGDVKIRRWILLVPYFDSKQIVGHAAKKTEEVIAANLSYVHNDTFRVMIEDEETFIVERDQLLNANLTTLSVVSEQMMPGAIADWADEHDALVRTLDEKTRRLPTLHDDRARRTFRDLIIKHFLEGQNSLEELRKYPTIYEKIRRAKSERERYLATEVMLATGSVSEILRAVLEDTREVVKSEVLNMSVNTLDAVAWEAVADWLIRCPLDFPRGVPDG